MYKPWYLPYGLSFPGSNRDLNKGVTRLSVEHTRVSNVTSVEIVEEIDPVRHVSKPERERQRAKPVEEITPSRDRFIEGTYQQHTGSRRISIERTNLLVRTGSVKEDVVDPSCSS